MIGLRFGDVEAVLTAVAEAGTPGSSASRMKYLQRRGFPAEVNPGPGGKVAYGFGQLIELAVVFELAALGVAPSDGAAVVGGDRDGLREAFREAWWCREVPAAWDDRPIIVVTAGPSALAVRRASAIVADISAASGPRSAFILDPVRLLDDLARALVPLAGLTAGDVDRGFEDALAPGGVA